MTRPMTITEKILAHGAGLDDVEPGQLVTCKVDLAMANDVTGPLAAKEFRKIGVPVWDPNRMALVQSHFVPAKDIKSAAQAKEMRDFAREHNIKWYFEVGEGGIEHALLPETGLAAPGQIIIGADSHTCTYGGLGAFSTGVGSTDLAAVWATGEIWLKVPPTLKFVFNGKLKPWITSKDLILYTIGQIGVDGALYQAMEFAGEAIESLSVEARLSLANMAIEAGGKSGIIAPDEKTLAYVEEKQAKFPYRVYKSDPDARYAKVYEWDVTGMDHQIACPYSPDNVKPIGAVAGTPVHQIYIGSCTNGRIEDLRIVAQLWKGRKISQSTRAIVVPATQGIYLQAMREGLLEIFIQAGAAVSTPTCGACLGGHMGIIAEGERCLSTTNRNFPGRMGHPKAEVFLASPAVAAASALSGKITAPEEVAAEWVA